MPTFTAIALERFLEPGDSRSASESNLDRTNSTPVRANGAAGYDSKLRKSVPLPPSPHHNAVRRKAEKEKEKAPRPQISPALYATPEATPLPDSPLCTTLSSGGFKVRTVEHLLSVLEATGIDNCRVEISTASGDDDRDVEVPILDGSAREWVDAIEQIGLDDAVDQDGNACDRMAPFLIHPTYVKRNSKYFKL